MKEIQYLSMAEAKDTFATIFMGCDKTGHISSDGLGWNIPTKRNKENGTTNTEMVDWNQSGEDTSNRKRKRSLIVGRRITKGKGEVFRMYYV